MFMDCSFFCFIVQCNFVLECPLYNPIRDKFASLVENVVLGSLKSLFQ